VAGEPDDAKVSSPVRRGADGKGPGHRDLASRLPYFLNLPAAHSQGNLQRALVANLRQFLLELGGDFTFAGEGYRLQVGGRDFFVDLLFYHRGLTCLVAFELKVGQFEPADLGQLQFYLEALDRDVKKPHERPSIGVLLCATSEKNPRPTGHAPALSSPRGEQREAAPAAPPLAASWAWGPGRDYTRFAGGGP
jgi:hypothetical protein